MGLRYVHAEPRERGEGWLELRLDENHKPPVYLATVRVFADRKTAPDLEHVRDVAAPVLGRLACASVAEYLEKARVLDGAKAAIAARADRPARFEEGGLLFERARELVTTTLEPRERDVYHVSWRGERALSFWFAERVAPELYSASSAFRADARMKPRAIEHGFSYVPWAILELEQARAFLLASPKPLDLGLPLEVTDQLPKGHTI